MAAAPDPDDAVALDGELDDDDVFDVEGGAPGAGAATAEVGDATSGADGGGEALDLSDLGPWWRAPDGVDLGRTAHLDAAGRPHVIERRFTVAEDFVGYRLDHYLKRMIPRLSRTRIQAVIASQLVRADGRPARASTSVGLGDEYVLRRPARAEPPCPRTFTVLYRDDEAMVVDKPAGLPVHASAKFYFNTLTRVVEERFPGEGWQICHRLDRETSGTLVLARGRAAAAALKGAFERKRADKTYLAIVHGDPPWPGAAASSPSPAPGATATAAGTTAAADTADADADADTDLTLSFPLRLARPGDPSLLPGVRMLVDPGGPDSPDALPSITRVRVLARVPGYALVRCHLVTGRQHQIRAHLAHAGFPIVGDKLYGHGERTFMAFCDRGLTRELALRFELPRHALHAHRIRIPHPSSGATLDVTAPLAWDLSAFLAARRGAPP
ncbi:MAG TPA: RluA family pseudouridine synthase [Kofleriaceae bacterium]|nr:RluA family pseudouridine synthase [Kofleriaceae bacterium]